MRLKTKIKSFEMLDEEIKDSFLDKAATQSVACVWFCQNIFDHHFIANGFF